MQFTELDTLIIGLWFVIIGYFFLLFIYFLVFRYREKRNPFHLGFGLFFVLLGAGRILYLIWDFYAHIEIWWRLATVVSWLAIFTVFLALAYQILERKLWQIVFISSPPLIIAVLILVLPWLFWPPSLTGGILTLGYITSNYAILPLYVIVLPALFFYIGIQLTGQLRTSNFLLGTGFLVYYGGRVLQAVLPTLGVIIAPAMVLIAIGIIAMGVLLEASE
ncbi:MAG: hypothetical protein ACXACH_02735 [Candidatus Hermodarchaeia archaeon]|jgi:hypothetical protein